MNSVHVLDEICMLMCILVTSCSAFSTLDSSDWCCQCQMIKSRRRVVVSENSAQSTMFKIYWFF